MHKMGFYSPLYSSMRTLLLSIDSESITSDREVVLWAGIAGLCLWISYSVSYVLGLFWAGFM